MEASAKIANTSLNGPVIGNDGWLCVAVRDEDFDPLNEECVFEEP